MCGFACRILHVLCRVLEIPTSFSPFHRPYSVAVKGVLKGPLPTFLLQGGGAWEGGEEGRKGKYTRAWCGQCGCVTHTHTHHTHTYKIMHGLVREAGTCLRQERAGAHSCHTHTFSPSSVRARARAHTHTHTHALSYTHEALSGSDTD
jgi:hypothetical protein